MRFEETPLEGVRVVELERIEDERGWFARTYDGEEFARHGIAFELLQCNSSYNARCGTLRGMHYQADPHGEPKLVRCVRGAIFDVAVDLRAASPSYRRWYCAELSEGNDRMLFIPPGVAHGFQTLAEGCEVLYAMGHRHVPQAARGVRWDDPAFAIAWPPAPVTGRVISERDRSYPDFPD
ncbi:MAG TPA: dTDP-4-dehydrorhamnose 3,5-epimerase [Solirubrobacteraceae bacterium]|jgi:dTDP-4-dehydrorhamnose 3,5-epimerase